MTKEGRSPGRVPDHVNSHDDIQAVRCDVRQPSPGWAAETARRGSEHQKKSEHIRFELVLLTANILNIIEASLRSTPCWKT